MVNEILDDVPQLRQIISNDIVLMLQQKIDAQIINADGTSPAWTGVAHVAGLQTVAKGSDNVLTAILKAKTRVVKTGRAMPSVVVIHPDDWQNIVNLRAIGAASLASGAVDESTVNTYDGAYIWGHPSQAGVEMVWGVPVVVSTVVSAGTAYIGDFARYSQIRDREAFTVEYSNAPSDYALQRKTAIIGGVRMTFFVTRGEAFAAVTGI